MVTKSNIILFKHVGMGENTFSINFQLAVSLFVTKHPLQYLFFILYCKMVNFVGGKSPRSVNHCTCLPFVPVSVFRGHTIWKVKVLLLFRLGEARSGEEPQPPHRKDRS